VTRRTIDPNGSDPGATRRTMTMGGPEAASATRRTLASGPVAAAAAATEAARPAARPAHWWARLRWRRLLVVLGIIMVANEAQVMRAGGELRSALPGLPRGESDAVWRRYRDLRSRSVLGIGTFGLRSSVRDWYVAEADELIADYRSDTPVIRENGWRDAAALLGRAAALDPRDRSIRARILYCRGQLARINAQAAKSRQPADAQRYFNAATASFEEAARLRPRWADPQLGLARTYVYGLEDPEHARDALDRAEQNGYVFGNRDMALLGDGYRLRAARTWSRAPDFRDLPQEDTFLESVRADCEHALRHYETIPAYGEVSANIRKVQDLLARVEAREEALREQKLRNLGLGLLAPFLGKS
jgi:hypothetical protein